MKYKRIIIKLSGEGLANKQKGLAIDFETVKIIAGQIKEIQERGIQVGVIVGGGNFWRGVSAEKNGIPRSRADYIGMLATIMNSLALQSGFEANGVSTKVQSAVNVDSRVAEYYIKEKAISYLEKGELVIFAGGTGRPYFTTDTTSTLVASEIGADIILMGKNGVDGIYSSDPKTDPNAEHINVISYDELLERGLSVMDSTAAAMARDNGIELIVFNINKKDALVRAIDGQIKHTKVVR